MRLPLLAGLYRAAGLVAALVLAVAGALAAAVLLMGAPRGEVEQLALLLSGSGGVSLLAGLLLVRWTGTRFGSLRLRLAAAFGIGQAIVIANILATSALMFLSSHDLALLLLLLAFAAVLSVGFGIAVAAALAADLESLGRAAHSLAQGDFSTRVTPRPRARDEVAQLAGTFNSMAAALEAAFARERTLEASRRELVAAVSHDLRTPLATTRAMIEAIQDGVVAEPSEVRRYLRLVLAEVQHLTRLIDDLFELSQIEGGSLTLQRQLLRAEDVVHSTLSAYQARATAMSVRLDERIATGLPLLQADAARLDRVLRNLLDNAMQHTPPGGRIEVAVAAAGDTLEFSVADSGGGIEPAERERVFERFYRGSQARTRREGNRPPGAGLGLAIARGLVNAHGGHIWVDTAENGGARFRFALPLAKRGDPPTPRSGGL